MSGKIDESELLRKIMQGDSRAETQLYRHSFEYISRYTLTKCRQFRLSEEIAGDIVQDVYVIAIRNARTAGASKILKNADSILIYLKSIAKNRIFEEHRSRSVLEILDIFEDKDFSESDQEKGSKYQLNEESRLIFDDEFWATVDKIESDYNKEKELEGIAESKVKKFTFRKIVEGRYLNSNKWQEVTEDILIFDPGRRPPYTYNIVYGNLWFRIIKERLQKFFS